MHRNKPTPTHKFPVTSTVTFGTGIAKEREPVNVDKRRRRGYPRTLPEENLLRDYPNTTKQKSKPSDGAMVVLWEIMRATRAFKRTKEIQNDIRTSRR